MQYVVDASVALSWIFADEYSPYAEHVLAAVGESNVLVPMVWPLELANGLLTAVRRARLPAADAPYLLGVLDRLQIQVDHDMDIVSLARATVRIGLAHRFSAYDASYLELAIRRGLSLATQDQRLAQAATAAGVVILEP